MPSHILLLAIPAWGHLSPLVGLACKLVQRRPGSIIVTLPIVTEFKDLVEKQIHRHLSSEEDKPLKDNIHVISLGGEGGPPFVLFQLMTAAFEPFYSSLHSLAPVKCATGPVHTFTQAPNVVIADFFFYDFVSTMRKINDQYQQKVQILCWNSAALIPIMRVLGPEALGGLGNVEAKAKVLAAETGKSYEEAELEVFNPQKGEVILAPGMPPMYDYEFYPHNANPQILEIQIPLHKKAFKMLLECGGLVSVTSPAFEPEGCKAAKAWFAETNRPVYAVGPTFSKDIIEDASMDSRKLLSSDDQLVINFLDKIAVTVGDNSLLYISFGTFFWPPGEGMWNGIEYALDSGIPVLLSYNESKFGKVPENVLKKFEESDKALISIWTPQKDVLQHRATGWLLTHCGQNSMMEAIIQGIPMIAWPMDADQPTSATYISVSLNIAYQVIEARSGPGLRPLYRGITPTGTLEALREEIKTILRNAFGEDGKKKRENVRVLRDKLRAGLREGGDCFVELDRFIEDYLSA